MSKLIGAVLVGLIMVTTLFQSALAAPTQRTIPVELACEDNVCRFQLDLGVDSAGLLPDTIWLETARQALHLLPGESRVVIDDALTLVLPEGRLQFLDANLTATFNERGAITDLQGAATLPLPTFGLLGDLLVVTPTQVEFGYGTGAQLAHLDQLPTSLDPARRYIYIDADAGLRLLTEQLPGYAAINAPGHRFTLISDLSQPMVWFNGEIIARTDTHIALLDAVVEPIAALDWLPGAMPLRQTTSLALQGQFGRDVPGELDVDGSVRLDTALASFWPALDDSTPILIAGGAFLDRSGLQIVADADIELAPAYLMASGAEAQLVVPFAFARLSDVESDSAFSAELTAHMQMPMLDVDRVASGQIALQPQQVVMLTQEAWQKMVESAADVSHGANDLVQVSWAWAADKSEAAYAQPARAVETGWTFDSLSWCNIIGSCDPKVEQPEQIAQAAVLE